MTCSCCQAKAIFEVSGGGLCCGKHLAYIVRMTAPLQSGECKVTVLEKEKP